MIIEIPALSLAENGVIFCYNHVRRGDYSGRTNFQNSRLALCQCIWRGNYVPVNSKTAHAPPPGQTPGHLTFWKMLVKFPAMLPVYMVKCPTRWSFKEGQIPHPPGMLKQTVETSSAKFSTTTNFLFNLSSLHTLNKGIFHDSTI